MPVIEQQQPGSAGIYVTTKDSFTLTDGPTIFISNDVEKIAKFCVQQANIPVVIMKDLMEKIEYNNVLNEKIGELENRLETLLEQIEKSASTSAIGKFGKSTKGIKKINREALDETGENKSEINKINNEILSFKSLIKTATLNENYVPNKKHHIEKWAHGLNTTNSFTSNIDEGIVNQIMLLKGIADIWKVLLMMGIGVFTNHENITYTEIMKKLADSQQLYMIIASSDYIYGTNYSFCHGYFSKDLDLTQEKIIQALGRVGRSNIQQNYTLRFRDNEQIMKLFTAEADKPEIINMNRLFNSNNVEWEANENVIEYNNESETDSDSETETEIETERELNFESKIE
jgi:hypothetical protein